MLELKSPKLDRKVLGEIFFFIGNSFIYLHQTCNQGIYESSLAFTGYITKDKLFGLL